MTPEERAEDLCRTIRTMFHIMRPCPRCKQIADAIRAAVDEEREACALVADAFAKDGPGVSVREQNTADAIAETIRDRATPPANPQSTPTPPTPAPHEWVEVVPPRVYGGDSRPKMAVQCRRCGQQKILVESDAKYILTTPCPGPPTPPGHR